MFPARLILVLACATIGCSSSSSSGGGGPTTIEKASCVSSGASYVVHFAEHAGGTCGPIPDSVVNTSPSGTIQSPSACTNRNREDGCNVFVDLTCTATDRGVTFTITETGEVKWAADGSKGSGTVSEHGSASDGSTCDSTYDVTYTRQ